MKAWRDLRRNLALMAGVVIDKRVDLRRLEELLIRLRPRQDGPDLIRLGGDGDGGYLVPDDLDTLVACLSPGVSTECGFDLALADRGLEVFMADASVAGPPQEHPRFHFTPHFIEPFNSARSMTFDRFAEIAEAKCPTGDFLLQMDIEGAEWTVLLSASEATLARCRILVIEFHNLHRLFAASHFDAMASVFNRLLSSYEVAHIHPNNTSKVATIGEIKIPSVMEFTFHRRDRAGHITGQPRRFPHPLDRDCASDRPTLVLPAIWRPD